LLFLEAHKEISFNITKMQCKQIFIGNQIEVWDCAKKIKKSHQWWRCNLTKTTTIIRVKASNHYKMSLLIGQNHNQRMIGYLVWKVVNYDCGLNKNIKKKSWTQRHNFLKKQASFRSLTSRVFNKKKLLEYLTKVMIWFN